MTFTQQVQAAYEAAARDATPFVPSRAQVEDALMRLVVTPMLSMNDADARAFMRVGFVGFGYDSVAVRLYKAARAEKAA